MTRDFLAASTASREYLLKYLKMTLLIHYVAARGHNPGLCRAYMIQTVPSDSITLFSRVIMSRNATTSSSLNSDAPSCLRSALTDACSTRSDAK